MPTLVRAYRKLQGLEENNPKPQQPKPPGLSFRHWTGSSQREKLSGGGQPLRQPELQVMDSPISEKLGSTSGTISTASRLLKLPAELRIIILRYLLPSATRQFKVYTDYDLIYTDKKWSCHSKHRHHERISPSLSILRTNRLIYYEALSILYGENAFHFIGSNFLPILDFIRRLSPEAQSLVRRIKITMLPDGRNPRAGQLEEFCRIVHYILPGLNKFDSDSWIWF